MSAIHPVVSSRSQPYQGQSIVAVVCAYACLPGVAGEAGRCWNEALGLARAGFDVWVVTPSEQRVRIECSIDKIGVDGLHVLFWDAPPAWGSLKHGRLGVRLHCALWYRLVGGAIAHWQKAVGMCILRRVVYRSRASVTYLALPSVRRADHARLAWRALCE